VFFIIFNLLKGKSYEIKKLVLLFFIYYFLLRALLYLILIPLELSTSGKSGMHNLQFSGGQYHNIAILMLVILVITYLNNKSINLKFENFFAWLLYIITVVLSYSRVGILLLVLYIIIYYFFFTKKNIKHYLITTFTIVVIYFSIRFINLDFEGSLIFQ
jgi:hypothetical protein